MTQIRHVPAVFAAAFLALFPAASASAAEKIKLRLFAKQEISRSGGCSLALWQSNRDPDWDRYAYVYYEQLSGRNYSRRSARIKIGNEVLRLSRIAAGGRTTGYGIYSCQLYRIGQGRGHAILELQLEPEEGEAVEVSGGRMIVVMPGKTPFTIRVKGGAGCFASAAPRARSQVRPGPAATNVPQGMFKRYDVGFRRIPRAVVDRVRRRYKCELDVMKSGVTGFQMSEESALWEFPCERFAASSSAVYALVYLPNPAQNFQFLRFQAPRGAKRPTASGVLLNPQWNVRTRTVTSVSLGRGSGDCGTLERHRVTAAGEFKLIEFREKPRCDGKAVAPGRFPLVYRSR